MTAGTTGSAWQGQEFTARRLAAALGCTEQAAEELILLLASAGRLTGTQRVGMAIAWALHRQAGMALPASAAIVRRRRALCEAVLSTLDFFPPARGDERRVERDPFMFFAPHASEAAAAPAIDAYVDVMDGRRVCWRKPRRDPYRLACELHRLSMAVKSDDTPALQEEYLDLLAGLRGPVAHDTEWIGTVRDEAFTPAPERFAEPSPTMRQGPGIGSDPTWSANAYGTCVSVNISLAARCFKRRMLGLDVSDPFVGRSQAGSHGAPAPG